MGIKTERLDERALRYRFWISVVRWVRVKGFPFLLTDKLLRWLYFARESFYDLAVLFAPRFCMLSKLDHLCMCVCVFCNVKAISGLLWCALELKFNLAERYQ